jgi:hypothetical protein
MQLAAALVGSGKHIHPDLPLIDASIDATASLRYDSTQGQRSDARLA